MPEDFCLLDLGSSWASRVLKTLQVILTLRTPRLAKGPINFDTEKKSLKYEWYKLLFPKYSVYC